MKGRIASVTAAGLLIIGMASPALAGTPNGQKGYEGRPGNQGGYHQAGQNGYEGQPGNQGGKGGR